MLRIVFIQNGGVNKQVKVGAFSRGDFGKEGSDGDVFGASKGFQVGQEGDGGGCEGSGGNNRKVEEQKRHEAKESA